MKRLLFVLTILGILSSYIQALDLMIGINISNKSIKINDKHTGDKAIARMNSEIKYSPVLGLRIQPGYFGDKSSNWGYFFQFDGMIFDTNKQTISNKKKEDIGTSIKGYSLFAVPTVYYHFNKKSNTWSQKVGIGIGAGYLSMSGNFKITKENQADYGQIKTVDINKVGIAVGLFFEFSKGKHSIIIQDFGPSIDDNNYKYMQFNLDMMYRYKFTI